MAKLHFSNLAPSSKKTTLLSVVSDDHVFTRNETMQAHIEYYGSSVGWNYDFSLVVITDKTNEDMEYLTEKIHLEPSDSTVNKYTFLEPEKDSEHYLSLKINGVVYLTFAEYTKYMELT